MSNNTFKIDIQEMEEASEKINKAYLKMDNTGNNVPRKFNSMNKTKLFGKGISVIDKQTKSISYSLGQIRKSIDKHTNHIADLEIAYQIKASEIEIPQDFVRNDSRQLNTINDIYLSKKDGRSVNEGSEQKPQENLSSSSITAKELENIKSDKEQTIQKLNEKTIIDKEHLEKVNKDNETEESVYDENYEIEQTILNSINKFNDYADFMATDTPSAIEKTTIEDINNNSKTGDLTINNDRILDSSNLKEQKKQ